MIARLWRAAEAYFPGGSFKKNVLVLAGGTALGSGLLVLVSPIITRIYSPSALGQMGVFYAFVSFCAAATSLRYEAAIVISRDRREAAHLLLGCLLLALPTTLVFSALFAGLIHQGWLGFGILPTWSALLALPSLLILGSVSALRYWWVREENFSFLSRVSVGQGVGRALGQVGMGFLPLGWVGLLFGELLGRGAAVGVMASGVADSIRASLPWDRKLLTGLFRQHRKFPIYSLPSSLIDNLAATIPLPLMAHYYGAESAGYFALVQRVVQLPVSLICSSVAEVFHGRMAVFVRNHPQKVRPFFLRVCGVLLLGSLVPAGVLALMASWFGFVFGEKWAAAGALLPALIPWAVAQLAVSPTSRLIFVLDGQQLKLVYDFFSVGGVVLALYFGFQFGLSFPAAVLVMSLSQVLAFGVYFLLIFKLTDPRRVVACAA